jgi:hypothetical protein
VVVQLEGVNQQVRAMAGVRIGIGAALLLTPGLSLRVWLGRRATAGALPMGRLLARSAGIRDVALGLGTLFAVRHGSPVRGWLEASMVADTGDLVSLVLAARELPRWRMLATAGSAAGAVAIGRRLVAQLPASVAPAEPVLGTPTAPSGFQRSKNL